MTEERETTETTEEAPQPATVGENVTKTAYPQVYDGLVLNVSDGKAYVVGRREEGGPWTLAVAAAEQFVRRDSGDIPGMREVGEALVRAQATIEADNASRREELEAAQARAMEATNQLAAFKTRVRETAIKFVTDNNYDVDYLNDELLDPLGLDHATRTYRVPVDLQARQSVYVDVEATSEDDARQQVESNMGLDDFDIDRDAWEADTDWQVDTYNIEEVTD